MQNKSDKIGSRSERRIVGIDVARALAIIGMIVVNFKMVLGQDGDQILKSIASVFDGKAAATFVFLAGIGIAITTKSKIIGGDISGLNIARVKLLKRAIVLLVLGLSYNSIWPADILHFYGIYMMLLLPFISANDKWLLIVSAGLIAVYPVLMIFFDYNIGWDFETMEYTGFWSLAGFFRNLFYNGFHPVLPWASFMFFGFWFGRQDLRNEAFIKKALKWSVGGFVLVQLTSWMSIEVLSDGDEILYEELTSILGTSPMPPLPLYMINGISVAVLVMTLSILIAKRVGHSWVITSLANMGKLSLTFYVVHVIVGMGLIEVIAPDQFGEFSLGFSISYALGFSLCCIVFANLWLRNYKSGPLEWCMKQIVK